MASPWSTHLSAFPRLPLGVTRTPLETVRVGGRAILVKRDDLTAHPYGGNKVRKLEYILGHARTTGATRLITAGATGSHHALATTVYGRASGFAVTAVLFPQHRTPHVCEVLEAIAAAGADLRFTRRMETLPYALWRARRDAGAGGYLVAPGGSDPIGTLGYVAAALELDEQLAGTAEPDAIYVAAGTLGTAAGLALGLALAGRNIPVHAIRITSTLVTNPRILRRLVTGAAQLLADAGADAGEMKAAAAAALAAVRIVDDQLGAGYGHATAAGDSATTLFGEAGLLLDPTYTAKAAAALLAGHEARPLFWHTLSAHMPAPAAVPALPAPFAAYLAGRGAPGR